MTTYKRFIGVKTISACFYDLIAPTYLLSYLASSRGHKLQLGDRMSPWEGQADLCYYNVSCLVLRGNREHTMILPLVLFQIFNKHYSFVTISEKYLKGLRSTIN